MCRRNWLNGQLNLFLKRYVLQKGLEWLICPTHWKRFLAKSNFWKYVYRKNSLKWLNWYSSENKFRSFPFLKVYVLIADLIGWFTKIRQNISPKVYFLNICVSQKLFEWLNWMLRENLSPEKDHFCKGITFFYYLKLTVYWMPYFYLLI